MTYHYIQSEPGLWTVGTGTPPTKGQPSTDWEPESDWPSPQEAADRVIVLNGGTVTSKANANDKLVEALKLYHNLIGQWRESGRPDLPLTIWQPKPWPRRNRSRR